MSARIRSLVFALAALVPSFALAQAPAPAATPPVAAIRPHRFDEFGTVRIDEYYWLKDRNNPEVIRYLEDENTYTNAVMAHTQALQERLYDEMKGRVLQNDQSVPFREGSYFYYTRLVEGKNYPIYARKRGSLTAPEEIMLDANVLAEGRATFIVREWEISPAEDLLAYGVDTTGGRVNTVRFKNLRTGELLADVIANTIGGVAWAEDNRTLLYVEKDPVTLLGRRIRRHRRCECSSSRRPWLFAGPRRP
jgi:oligopeptidase B